MRGIVVLMLAVVGLACGPGRFPTTSVNPTETAAVPPEAPETKPLAPLIAWNEATDACEGHSLTAQMPADLGETVTQSTACLEEYFELDGCPQERVTQTLDASGRPLQARYEILDQRVYRRPLYVVPESAVMNYEYDAAGNIVLDTYDSLEQSNTTHRIERRFDSAKRLRWQKTHQTSSLGESEYEELWEYQPNGLLGLWEQRLDGKLQQRRFLTFDANGLPLTEELLTSEGATRLSTWQNGPFGAERMETQDLAGKLLAAWTWTYDAAGVRVKAVEEKLDGPLWTNAWVYDAAGRELRYTQDEDLDGTPEYIKESTYDAGGHPLSEVVSYGFRSGTPRVSSIQWTYDALGRMVERRDRPSWDPGATHTELRQYSSADSSFTAIRENRTAGGVLTFRDEIRVDRHGNQTLIETDQRGDGTAEIRIQRQYDSEGRLLESAAWNGEGVLMNHLVVVRDLAGNAVRALNDWNADGIADTRNESRYRCIAD